MTATSPGRLLQSILEASSTPLIAWAADGTVSVSSESFLKLLDTTRRDLDRRGRTGIVHPDDRPAVEQRIAAFTAGTRIADHFRLRLMTSSGSVVRTHSRLSPLIEDGTCVGILLECLEVGDALAVRDALDEQTAMFQGLFDQIGDAIYSLDGRRRMTFANHATERLFGRTFEEMQHTRLSDILFEEDVAAMYAIRESFDTGERIPGRLQFRIRRPDGSVRWVNATLLMQSEPGRGFLRSWVVARDVTREREREQRLAEAASEARHIALLDALTGLPNRRAFDDALARCAEVASANTNVGASPILAIIDLDQLKTINDQAGHQVGDEAIRTAGRALAERIRGDDQAFRIGGDEFAVIFSGGDPAAIAERLAAPIPFRPPVDPLLLSIGTATYGVDSDDPQEIFRIADSRMFEMKRARRSAY